MIDLHCHILPGVDDGAADLDEALDMAWMSVRSGVKAIVATPHCNLPGNGEPNYLDHGLLDRIIRLRRAIEDQQIPLRLYAGSEVFCTPDVVELLTSQLLLPLAGSRYLLTEFFFDESPQFMDHCLHSLAAQGCRPIVAHPERYDAVQRDPQLAAYWFSQGYLLQVNKGSILGSLGSRSHTAARWILQRGLAHAVASDAHDLQGRSPAMDTLRHHLEDNYSPEYAWVLLHGNPARIVRDKDILHA